MTLNAGSASTKLSSQGPPSIKWDEGQHGLQLFSGNDVAASVHIEIGAHSGKLALLSPTLRFSLKWTDSCEESEYCGPPRSYASPATGSALTRSSMHISMMFSYASKVVLYCVHAVCSGASDL